MASQGGKDCVVAFGPEMPGWGSWEWIGDCLKQELSKCYRTISFQGGELPQADLVFVVKHAQPIQWMEQAVRRAAVIFCPVDFYGSAAEIDADGPLLRKCSRIIVHCEGLRKYFAPYAPVEYVDHHVNFVAPREKTQWRREGYFLWVGVRTNLPALVEWVNEH